MGWKENLESYKKVLEVVEALAKNHCSETHKDGEDAFVEVVNHSVDIPDLNSIRIEYTVQPVKYHNTNKGFSTVSFAIPVEELYSQKETSHD